MLKYVISLSCVKANYPQIIQNRSSFIIENRLLNWYIENIGIMFKNVYKEHIVSIDIFDFTLDLGIILSDTRK